MQQTIKQHLRLLVGILLLCGASVANAALVDNGAYTTDTVTGCDWLDLTVTRGLSFDDVASRMGIGQQFEGWQFASRAEVTQFWTDAGGLGPFSGAASGETNWVGRLQSLWGKTYPFIYTVNGNLVQGTVAMTADVSTTCPTCNLTVYLLDNTNATDTSAGDFAEAVQLNEAYRSQGQVPIGLALVRESVPAVPEPENLPMIILGLLVIATSTSLKKLP